MKPAYFSTVHRWIAATGEVLVVIRYLHNGSRDFALITSPEKFDRLVDVCPQGAGIIVFRDSHLPLRGVLDDDLFGQVQDLLHGQDEYLLLNLDSEKPDDPRCAGEVDYLINLIAALKEMKGETIAIGECPDFSGPDNDSMISACKGEIEGSE